MWIWRFVCDKCERKFEERGDFRIDPWCCGQPTRWTMTEYGEPITVDTEKLKAHGFTPVQ